MGFFSKAISKISTASISAGFNGVKNVIDELHTSKEEKALIDIEFNKLQTEINKLEAGNVSKFVSGWRPFIGWICGFGFGFNFIIRPILNYVLLVFCPAVPIMASLEMGVLSTLLTGMLGFGALRTFEKHKNKARD
jgi:hypothetical protein